MSELVVVPDKKMPNLYRVIYEEGKGATPDFLKGLFSTRIAAKKRVMIYEARPKPQPIQYKGMKNITDEEEAELYEAAKIKAAKENAKRREVNGKKETEKRKNKD